MICQNCGNYAANYHYTSNINGQVTKQHLCAHCVRGMTGGTLLGLQNPMQFFTGAFREDHLGIVHSDVPCEPNEQNVPQQADSDLQYRRKLNQLRHNLQTAIRKEDFEQAACLRDEIYKLEQNEKTDNI